MGKNESELETIVTADDWGIPSLGSLQDALVTLQTTMNQLSAAPGWKGASADGASDAMVVLKKQFNDSEQSVTDIQSAIGAANTAKSHAYTAWKNLPSATVDPMWHAAALAGGTLIFPGLGTLAAETAIQQIQQHLSVQRETAAKQALDQLHSELPTAKLIGSSATIGDDRHDLPLPLPWPLPDPHGSGSGGVSLPSSTYQGGIGGGSLQTGLEGVGTGAPSAGSGIGGGTSADGNSNGTFPGSGVSGGLGGSNPGGSGSGGLPGGGIGMGVGGGASAAGIAAATRMGGGMGGGLGAGGLGAAAKGGTGGLLGSGAKTAGAAAAEEGAGGTAATKSGSSMMGGQGGQGGSEKEKRSGLGGLMAPKLEDEEELGPRSAGAMAGGRDAAGE